MHGCEERGIPETPPIEHELSQGQRSSAGTALALPWLQQQLFSLCENVHQK